MRFELIITLIPSEVTTPNGSHPDNFICLSILSDGFLEDDNQQNLRCPKGFRTPKPFRAPESKSGVSIQFHHRTILILNFYASALAVFKILTVYTLSYMDSNHKSQDQNLMCYHYTIRQFLTLPNFHSLGISSFFLIFLFSLPFVIQQVPN